MIKGIGVDIVDVSRIERSLKNEGFVQSVFTKDEILNCHGIKEEYFAGRFAAKEAVFKALNEKVDLRKIEILNNKDGSPYVNYPRINNIHLSISHDADKAIAFCVIESLNEE